MAKVSFGTVVTGISGSIEGVTFARGSNGTYCKKKGMPVCRERGLQPAYRSLIGYLSRYWGKTLDQAERDLWKAYADAHPRTNALGQSYRMSGINAFTSLCAQATRIFGEPGAPFLPPVTIPNASCASLVGSDGVVGGSIVLTWTENGTGLITDMWEIQMSAPAQSPGQSPEGQAYVQVALVAGGTETATLTDLLIMAWYWFRVRYVDQYGQVTAWVYEQYQAPAAP